MCIFRFSSNKYQITKSCFILNKLTVLFSYHKSLIIRTCVINMDAQPMNDQVISASDEEPKFLSSENEEISSNENQDAISKAIRQVEEQLNIQTSENTEETTLDPISRILRIGSTQKALRDQVSNLITDINKRGINNYQFIKDTLGNILEKVEGQASPPTGNLDKQEKLQNYLLQFL